MIRAAKVQWPCAGTATLNALASRSSQWFIHDTKWLWSHWKCLSAQERCSCGFVMSVQGKPKQNEPVSVTDRVSCHGNCALSDIMKRNFCTLKATFKVSFHWCSDNSRACCWNTDLKGLDTLKWHLNAAFYNTFSSSKQSRRYIMCSVALWRALQTKVWCYRSSFILQFLFVMSAKHSSPHAWNISQNSHIRSTSLDLTEACLGIWRLTGFFFGPGRGWPHQAGPNRMASPP